MVVTGDTAPIRLTDIFAGGFEMLHKPVDADFLRRALASLLRGRELAGLHITTPHYKT